MSLDPRAIATLGVGYGAREMAYLGLWPVGEVEPPPVYRPPGEGGAGLGGALRPRRLVRRTVRGPRGPEEVLVPDDWTAEDLLDLATLLAMSDRLN